MPGIGHEAKSAKTFDSYLFTLFLPVQFRICNECVSNQPLVYWTCPSQASLSLISRLWHNNVESKGRCGRMEKEPRRTRKEGTSFPPSPSSFLLHPPGGYMTCGWTGVCRPVFRKVPSSNYRNLLSYPLL